MSLSVAVIDALVQAGATVEQLAAAMKADVAAEEARREAKRDGNRRRQSEWRDRQRNADNALRDVTERDSVTPPSLDKETSPRPPKEINPIPVGISRPRKAAWACPEGVNEEHWRDFLANRKTKRLTNNPTAYRKVLTDIEQWTDDEWPPGRLVEHAAERGWGAIFNPRASNGHRPHHQPNNGSQHPGGRTGAAADFVFGGGGMPGGPL